MKKILFVSVSLLVWRFCFGAAYYVSPAGDDSWSGSSEFTFRTIGHPAGIVAPGDTVNIMSGIYYESTVIHNSGVPGNPIVFRVPPGEVVTVKAQLDQCFVITENAEYVVIEGFNLTNAHWVITPHAAGVKVLGNYCTVRNNHIFDNEMGVLIQMSEDSLNANHHNIVEGNIISNSMEAGIRVKRSDHNVIINNLIYNNGYTGFAAGAITYYGVNHIKILNNTLWNNAGPAIQNYNGTDSVTTPVSIDVLVANNISLRNDGGILFSVENKMINETTDTYSHNLWYNGIPGSPIVAWGNNNFGLGGENLTFTEYLSIISQVNPLSGEGELEADPLFSNPALLAFDLQSGSPAFDAGMNTIAELNLTGLTAAVDQAIDFDPPDLGFHHLPYSYAPNPEVFYHISFQAYPNPIFDKVRFHITFPQSSEQCNPKIRIYDLLGREVAALRTLNDSPNNHFIVDWQPEVQFASGVYFAVCNIPKSNQAAKIKLVIIK